MNISTVETSSAKETLSEISAVNTKESDEIPAEQKLLEKEAEDKGDEDSEVSKMIKESSESFHDELDVPVEETPEFQKQTKLTLDGNVDSKRLMPPPKKGIHVEKKLKYESPLEFLRLPKNKYDSRYVS